MNTIKMKKTYRGSIRVDIVNEKIFVTAAFRKACANIDSDEYTLLQMIRLENPTFKVEERSIKKNPNKESYKGLTYDFMRRYIQLHDGEKSDVMAEFKEMLFIAECHSISYPKVRDWFFEMYPDVKNFKVSQLETKSFEQLITENAKNEQPIAA